jgi:hypothetical protein
VSDFDGDNRSPKDWKMRIVRVLLLLFIGFVVLLMVCLPTASHTKRTRQAFREYFEAQRADEAGSTAETKRLVEAARLKVEEAKRLDRKRMLVLELGMLGVLGIAMYGFVRAGRRIVDGRQGVTES